MSYVTSGENSTFHLSALCLESHSFLKNLITIQRNEINLDSLEIFVKFKVKYTEIAKAVAEFSISTGRKP